MSENELTAEDFLKTLTGFDEIAIQKAFGATLKGMMEDDFRLARSLVFVDRRRSGLKDADAYTEAMNLPMGALTEWFATEEPEAFPEEPVTDQGKAAAPVS